MKRRLKENFYFLLMTITIGLAGCYYDHEEAYFNLPCDTEEVSFEETIQPLIVGSCAIPECHVPGSERRLLRSYAEIKKATDSYGLHDHVVVRRDMPPDAPLSRCDIAEIDQWVADGAPNN